MIATINTTFTSTTSNENILNTSANIKNRICGALNISESEYNARLSNNGFKMSFTLFFNGANTVSVNSGLTNSLIADSVYDSGVSLNVKSISIGTATSGTISIVLD